MDVSRPFRDAPAPVVVLPARATRRPVLFVSAHSGNFYPDSFLEASRLDPLTLRNSEDGLVDKLFADAPDFGANLIAATFPRAFCDANREAWELDPQMFEDRLPSWVTTSSPRLEAGLGTIARVVSSGERIYRRKLRFAEAEARVRDCWVPFHDRLRAEIEETRHLFGHCLVIDCHSMPGRYAPPAQLADFVLGDAHGRSCGAALVRGVTEVLRAKHYRVHHNTPYAGGYITRHYGRPAEGVEVLQIEISRALYLDEVRRDRLAGFEIFRRDISRLIAIITDMDKR
jgi:N-formylglutamate deformylase